MNAKHELGYTRNAHKTATYFRHCGPRRILQSLDPKGQTISDNFIVQPPAMSGRTRLHGGNIFWRLAQHQEALDMAWKGVKDLSYA